MAWTLIETDTNTNKDISSAVSIGARTVATAGKVGVLVLATQVAGGGDYVIYMTITRSGTEYRVIPTTTATAAASLTTIAFSGETWANASDVVTVYIDGLAGDTTTPDLTVDWFEGAAATAAEMAKVPKSDGTVTFNSTVLASINAEVVDVMRTDVIPDSTPAHEARPTMAQGILWLTRLLTEKAVSATTVTIYKEDGTTGVATLTLDDAANPTSVTRTT